MKSINILIKATFYLCLGAIEYLATTPRNFEIITNSWDKANHFLAFFTLYLLLSLSYEKLKTNTKIFILLLFGLQIECVQHFLPFRQFSLLDVFADGIGIMAGVFIKKWYNRGLSFFNKLCSNSSS